MPQGLEQMSYTTDRKKWHKMLFTRPLYTMPRFLINYLQKRGLGHPRVPLGR